MKTFDIFHESEDLVAPKIKMPALKYPHNGLDPVISSDTVRYHYGKHTKKYFENIAEFSKGTKFEKENSLDKLVEKCSQMDDKLANNVRQAWNHVFYWNCLSPKNKSGKPSNALLALINSKFGSFDSFKKKFAEQGVAGFGSTWTWLVLKDGKLAIETTQDSDIPNATLLLVVDFWEHSYYLDSPADKKKYAEEIWNIINWDFVSQNLT